MIKKNWNGIIAIVRNEGCRACEIAKSQLSDIDGIIWLDTADAEDLVREFGILSVPTFLKVRNGEVVDIRVGWRDKDAFLDWMEE